MPIPDFQSLMLPTLKALSRGSETPVSKVRERIVAAERLAPADVQKMLSSGRQSVFANRVSWALLHLRHAGLTEGVRRGVWRLTAEGRKLLKDPPPRIDMRYLREKYPAFVAYRTGRNAASPDDDPASVLSDDATDTPEEALENAARRLREALEVDVLDRVRSKEKPAFLEQLVIDLLIKMGYGGGDAGMARVTGRSGDGGIDGTIKEDVLGLGEIYLQAKKYADSNTVGESDLRNFAGAIDAAGTTKGVFVTTAGFTPAAKEYVKRSPKRIVLIDGRELARLMVKHDIGVRTRVHHKIKRIDEDYFDQEIL